MKNQGKNVKSLSTHIFRFGIATLLMASLLSFEFASASGPTCSVVFSEQSAIDRTIHDLAAMRISLDQAKAQGVSSIEITVLTTDFRKKEQALIEYLEINKIMTRIEFSEKIKQEIVRQQSRKKSAKEENDKKEAEEAHRRREKLKQVKYTVIDGTLAIFHRVEPGSFKMGEPGKQVDVTITKPFEMMAMPMTQIIWQKVAELAAQKFPGKYDIDEKPSYPRVSVHPVDYVSFNNIEGHWLKALNELSQAGEPALVSLFPGHKQGDVYRLPYEAEWEFVARARGEYGNEYAFKDTPKATSLEETRPVAKNEPIMVDGKDFYDMSEFFWEWIHDWHGHDLSGGVDPQGPKWGDVRVYRSGSGRGGNPPHIGENGVGFRLVRIVQ